jgi:tetratricopeptide (TPR) repeat protein
VSLAQARLLIGVRRWPEARSALAEVLADPSAGGEPWFLLAQLELGVGAPGAARAAATRGLGLSPDAEWGHRLLSIAELGLKHYRAAQQAAERAVQLSPTQPETLYTLANVLQARKKLLLAGNVAERNLTANPVSKLARVSAASVALRRRRWPEAEQHARAGLRLDPQDGDLMMQLGVALQAQGKRAEAAETYAAAVRTDPRDQRGRRALGRLGLPAVAGGGFVVFKVLSLIAISEHTSWLSAPGQRHARVAAVVVAAGLLLGYGLQEFRQRRAEAQISPHLRAIARRERRTASRYWLLIASLAAGLLTIFALAERDYPTVAVLAVLAGTAGYLRRRWSPSIAGVGWRTRLSQSIRWRFR